jgi:hypothetical protein
MLAMHADVRIAMWSGPRTLSTAMMRSWENRGDTVVVDEPLYAFYLSTTGIDHPGRDAIIASQPTDWRVVVRRLVSDPLPPGRTISYQKHMTHHVLGQVDRSSLAPLRHAHLIRDPHALLASYSQVGTEPTLDDLGLRQQVELFRDFGGPVVDAADVASRPEPTLRALCAALDVQFDPGMLSWPAGPRTSDGAWAPYWYDRVRCSTGFTASTRTPGDVPERLRPLLETTLPYYDELARARLRVA